MLHSVEPEDDGTPPNWSAMCQKPTPGFWQFK